MKVQSTEEKMQNGQAPIQSGQALVLVLLSLAVVITIVLFVLSRSVTDIAISDSESQSISAFSAAEAGVEQALVIGTNITPTNIGDSSYSAQITDVARGKNSFVYPIELNSGDTVTLWFKSQDPPNPSFSGNRLRICWGNQGTASNVPTTPAIELTVVYESPAANPSNAKIFRATYDPYPSRSPSNNFGNSNNGNCEINGKKFAFRTGVINLSSLSNLQFAIVKVFYNTTTSQPIGFDSVNGALFPTQGKLIDSSGTSGQSSRKVEVFQGWPEIPSPFLYGIYSPNGLTK